MTRQVQDRAEVGLTGISGSGMSTPTILASSRARLATSMLNLEGAAIQYDQANEAVPIQSVRWCTHQIAARGQLQIRLLTIVDGSLLLTGKQRHGDRVTNSEGDERTIA